MGRRLILRLDFHVHPGGQRIQCRIGDGHAQLFQGGLQIGRKLLLHVFLQEALHLIHIDQPAGQRVDCLIRVGLDLGLQFCLQTGGNIVEGRRRIRPQLCAEILRKLCVDRLGDLILDGLDDPVVPGYHVHELRLKGLSKAGSGHVAGEERGQILLKNILQRRAGLRDQRILQTRTHILDGGQCRSLDKISKGRVSADNIAQTELLQLLVEHLDNLIGDILQIAEEGVQIILNLGDRIQSGGQILQPGALQQRIGRFGQCGNQIIDDLIIGVRVVDQIGQAHRFNQIIHQAAQKGLQPVGLGAGAGRASGTVLRLLLLNERGQNAERIRADGRIAHKSDVGECNDVNGDADANADRGFGGACVCLYSYRLQSGAFHSDDSVFNQLVIVVIFRGAVVVGLNRDTAADFRLRIAADNAERKAGRNRDAAFTGLRLLAIPGQSGNRTAVHIVASDRFGQGRTAGQDFIRL